MVGVQVKINVSLPLLFNYLGAKRANLILMKKHANPKQFFADVAFSGIVHALLQDNQ